VPALAAPDTVSWIAPPRDAAAVRAGRERLNPDTALLSGASRPANFLRMRMLKRLARGLALLVLVALGLEVAMHMSGESLIGDLLELTAPPEPGERVVDLARVRAGLTSHDEHRIHAAFRDLMHEPAAVPQVLPELTGALRDVQPPAQRSVLKALARAKTKAAAAMPEVLRLLRSPDPDVRIEALRTAGALVDHVAGVLPPPAELLSGIAEDRQRDFANFSGVDPEVIEGLLHAMRQAWPTYWSNVTTLNSGWLGPRRNAVAAWWGEQHGFAESPDMPQAQLVIDAEALGPGIGPWLAHFLEDPRPSVRLDAAISRLKIGVDREDSRSAKILEEALPEWAACEPLPGQENSDRATSWRIVAALDEVAALARKHTSEVVQRLGCCHIDDRYGLIELLEHTGGLAGCLPAVMAAVDRSLDRDDDGFWYFEVDSACSKLGPAGDAFIPRLDRALLSAKNRMNRSSFAYRLADYGPRAAAHVPNLRVMADAAEPELRSAARYALEKIDGKPRPGD